MPTVGRDIHINYTPSCLSRCSRKSVRPRPCVQCVWINGLHSYTYIIIPIRSAVVPGLTVVVVFRNVFGFSNPPPRKIRYETHDIKIYTYHSIHMGTGVTVREIRTSSTTTSEWKLTSYDTAVYTTDAIIIMTCTYIPINILWTPVASRRRTTMMLRSLKMAIFHTGFRHCRPWREKHHRDYLQYYTLVPPTI